MESTRDDAPFDTTLWRRVSVVSRLLWKLVLMTLISALSACMPAGAKPPVTPLHVAAKNPCAAPHSPEDLEFIGGNTLQLLIDGPATYESMLAAIENAEREILMETYIIRDDEVGRKFRDAMIERARAGVSVKVIYDGLASEDGKAFWSGLADAGADLHEYHPPEPTKNADFREYVTRDHRKVLVVDAKIGFVGGINHYDAYLNQYGWRFSAMSSGGHKQGRDPEKWRDTHLRFEGPAVAKLRQIFMAQWVTSESDAHAFIPAPTFEDNASPARMGFVVANGEDDDFSDIYHAYMHALATACKNAWITQAYFMPNKAFLEMLIETAHRGVDVRLLVPGQSDWQIVQYATRELYGDLLKAGVRIYEYEDGILHAKTAVVDGKWSTVGSSNLDALSFLRNDEVNAIIDDEAFAQEMEAMFQSDLKKSREITLTDWRERSWRQRILGKLFQLFKPWL